jgi:polyhydroxyalkanoate synthase
VFNSFPESPDDGLAAAKEIKGSWWPRWSEWLAQHSGGKRAAPAKPGNAKYKAIEPAPGRYVKQKA